MFKEKKQSQRGVAALLITVIVMSIGLTIAISSVFIFLNRVQASRNFAFSEQSYFASEAGVEDILLRLLDPAKIVPPTFPYSLTVASSVASVDITDSAGSLKYIDVEGDTSNRVRSVRATIFVNPAGTNFSVAAQVGINGIQMESNATINGNAFSNADINGASNTQINGNASAVGIVSSPLPDVSGTISEGVDLVPLPPFDQQFWKDEANINNDPIIGDYVLDDGSDTLGPRKIEGNMTIDGNASLTVTGPLHVTGNLLMDSNSDMLLDESFNSDGTVILVEGTITFSSNAEVLGTSADPKGYILIVSVASSTDAIDINSNSALEASFYALNGDISLGSNGDVVALVGQGLILNSNAEINFDMGLIDYTYSAGGSVSYDIINWEEQ